MFPIAYSILNQEKGLDMKKTVFIVIVSAVALAGCSRVERKLNSIMGTSTPVPVATTAPAATATPAPTATPKASVKPAPTAMPKKK
ncbi:hypothetical protein C5B42_02090 [Candidatus Cerribacteria bacterium 'Amazon FNV 2010 28 9']|uniref:Uncharacterized protein n=1 Tax=Candidatus Cerribacteria bacterium 'Amazon FNV 2010 28 9' TaxID=2081795 RepID=A0A317JP73_9BACT|nr:MAG: hypothetical protein C5B42_02090 [Candidatus Cerribacteria bacterium 'Amazon FNV 2010 28 9']